MVPLFLGSILILKEVSPSVNHMDHIINRYLKVLTSLPPELSLSPNRLLSDLYAPKSLRQPSHKYAQPDIAGIDKDIYNKLEPIPEDIEDYRGKEYNRYLGIAQRFI